ncbi:MAG: hypothetical protein U0165_14220 [Polyangiaceae bacterium]
MSSIPDATAVLAALVLVPGSLPRNRFFELYRKPELRGIRRRASELRELIAHLRDRSRAIILRWEHDECGARAVEYELPTLRFRRSLWLSRDEAAIVDVALARCRGEHAPSDAETLVVALLQHQLNAA